MASIKQKVPSQFEEQNKTGGKIQGNNSRRPMAGMAKKKGC